MFIYMTAIMQPEIPKEIYKKFTEMQDRNPEMRQNGFLGISEFLNPEIPYASKFRYLS